MNSPEEHAHDFGPPQASRMAGTPHRKCRVPGCGFVTLDVCDDGAPEETPETPCILRRWRGAAQGRTLIACFPYPRHERRARADGACFEHVGQHGEYDRAAILARTVAVKPSAMSSPDVVALMRELTNAYGYRLKIIRRGL